MSVLEALRSSHDRFAQLLNGLSPAQLTRQSYDDDWTIAQVASHLGSGAEIFTAIVDAGLAGEAAPGPERFRPVWEEWNARPPDRQAADAVSADGSFLDHVAGVPPEEWERWRLDLFGRERGLDQLLGMRLSEHAVHTWDIAVALDPASLLASDAVAVLIDSLQPVVQRGGKGAVQPLAVRVETFSPERQFVLQLSGEGHRLEPGPVGDGSGARLRTPAEAFIRLIYGRLDPDHTPDSVQAEGVDLDTLRTAFPGF